MKTIDFEQDIKPLSEFRSNTAKFVKQVKTTRRPLIITQHGKSSVVLIDINEYQKLIEKIELLEDIHLAETQLADGKGISHAQAKKEIMDRIK